MRKVAVARCAFVVLTLSMLAASGADKTVTNKELGFEITFPEAWTVKENYAPGFAISAISTKASGAQTYESATLTVVPRVDGEHVKAMAERMIRHGWTNEGHFALDESLETIIGDATGYKVAISWEPEHGGGARKRVIYYLLSEKRIFKLEITINKADFDLYAKDIDAIVKSFKLIEAK